MRMMALDIVVSGIIPTVVYHWLTTSRHYSEAQALAAVIVFPAIMSVVDVVRDGRVNVISGLSIAGIVFGLVAAWIGGDPRMLLIRESLFTVIVGIGALASLLVGKPLMYLFAGAAMQRMEPEKREAFERRWETHPSMRRTFSWMTGALGVLFIFEFAVKVAMVLLLPVETVLFTSPIVFNVLSLGGGAAIVLYGRGALQRSMAGEEWTPVAGVGPLDEA
jgi:hypothetical protein